MISQNIGAYVSLNKAFAPQAAAAGAINGTGIDRMPAESLQGYESCSVIAQTGVTTGTPTSFTVDVKIQDSADNSAFADVTGLTVSQITAASSAAVGNFNLRGTRRYVRAVCTVAFVGGTSPTVVVAGDVVLGGAAKVG